MGKPSKLNLRIIEGQPIVFIPWIEECFSNALAFFIPDRNILKIWFTPAKSSRSCESLIVQSMDLSIPLDMVWKRRGITSNKLCIFAVLDNKGDNRMVIPMSKKNFDTGSFFALAPLDSKVSEKKLLNLLWR